MSGGHSVFGGLQVRELQFAIIQNKKPRSLEQGFSKKGDDILSHIIAVPSAQAGLTSLFGMGRGEPRRNNHLKVLVVGCQLLVVGFPRTTKDSFNCSRRANILTHWDKEKIILKVLESFFRGLRPGGLYISLRVISTTRL